MSSGLGLATAAVQDAIRPRHSGRPLNGHEVRPPKEPTMDYAKMKQAIEGQNQGIDKDRSSENNK